jgi:hypothetical protein
MNDWIPLREHLHRWFSDQVDALAEAEPDRYWRGQMLMRHDRIVAQLVDLAELEILRQHIAQQERGEEKGGHAHLKRGTNGHAHVVTLNGHSFRRQ